MSFIKSAKPSTTGPKAASALCIRGAMSCCVAAAVAVGLSWSDTALAQGLPQLDAATFAPQLIWLAIIFAGLYILVTKWLLPNVSRVMDEREAQISQDLELARRDHESAQDLTQQQAKTLEATRIEAQAILAQAVQEAQATSSKSMEKAALQNARVVDAELEKLEEERKQLLSDLEDSAVELTQDIVRQLGVSALTKPVARRAVQAAVAQKPDGR